MANELGNILPPGARGYLIGERGMQTEGMNRLGMLGGLVGIRGALSEQALRDEQLDARAKLSMTLNSIPEIANHPVLSTLAQTRPEMLLPLIMPKTGDTKLAPGEVLLGPDMKPRYQAPFKPAEAPPSELARLLKERDALPAGDPNRTFYDQKIRRLTEAAPAAPSHQIVTGPNNELLFIDPRNPLKPGLPVLDPSGNPASKPEKALTEGQGNATMFGIRAVDMDKTLKEMQAAGYDPTTKSSALDRVAAGGLLTNWMASPEGQKYMNAGKNFVAAVLRKESGAQISAQEWTDGQMLYIPMPGDQPTTLEQKARNRELAIQGLRHSAGPGAKDIPPTFNPSPESPSAATGKVRRYNPQTGRLE